MDRKKTDIDLNLEGGSSLSNSQEAELLKSGFLVSSAIEIISVPEPRRGVLSQSEWKVLEEVVHKIEELREADDYLTGDSSRYMLRPESVDLVRIIKKTQDWEISDSWSEAIQLIRQVIDTKELLSLNEQDITKLLDILRAILLGIKNRITNSDSSQGSFISD